MSWEFISISHPKAAKAYPCEECGKTIEIGERHAYTAGKVEGDFCSYRLCEYCNRLAQAYCTEFDADEGFPLGDLRQCLRDMGVSDLDAWLAEAEASERARRAQLERRKERLRQLDGVCICTRCGATPGTYADRCEAALDERCEGFETLERVRSSEAAEEVL